MYNGSKYSIYVSPKTFQEMGYKGIGNLESFARTGLPAVTIKLKNLNKPRNKESRKSLDQVLKSKDDNIDNDFMSNDELITIIDP